VTRLIPHYQTKRVSLRYQSQTLSIV
jgi:hypothetical protein